MSRTFPCSLCLDAVSCHPDVSCLFPDGFGSRVGLPCVQNFRCPRHGREYSGLQVSEVFFPRALLRVCQRFPGVLGCAGSFHVPFLPGAHALFSGVLGYAVPFHVPSLSWTHPLFSGVLGCAGSFHVPSLSGTHSLIAGV